MSFKLASQAVSVEDVSISPSVGNNVGTAREALDRTLSESSRRWNRPNKKSMSTDTTIEKKDALNSESLFDQKLVVRVQKGDKRAFDLLVVKYQGKVASIVSRYVYDFHEISDVSQEAFIKAYRAIDNFRGDSAFYTWIYRIAINTAKNHLLAKGRRPPASDVSADEVENYSYPSVLKDTGSPESLLNRSQLENAVHHAIRALPEDLRGAFTLREFDGLSYEEIAEVMACPVGTVRSRIFRARESIDQAIQTFNKGGSQ